MASKKDTVCRGSIRMGNYCGKCSKCREDIAETIEYGRKMLWKVTMLRTAIDAFLSLEDTPLAPCEFDSKGHCKTHDHNEPCVVGTTKMILEQTNG